MKVKYFLFIIFSIAVVSSLLAQGSMSIPTTTLGANGRAVPSTMMVPMSYDNAPVQITKYDFAVILKNDSVISASAKAHHMAAASTLFVTYMQGKDKKKIYPKDTKRLEFSASNGEVIIGIPVDSAWLFKTEAGKINMYSNYPEPNSDLVVVIQNGDDGTLLNLTKRNAYPLISTDERAVELFQQGQLVEAIRMYNKDR